MSEDLLPKITKVIVDKLGVTEDKVKPEAAFAEDLGADSLDQVELVMALLRLVPAAAYTTAPFGQEPLAGHRRRFGAIEHSPAGPIAGLLGVTRRLTSMVARRSRQASLIMATESGEAQSNRGPGAWRKRNGSLSRPAITYQHSPVESASMIL